MPCMKQVQICSGRMAGDQGEMDGLVLGFRHERATVKGRARFISRTGRTDRGCFSNALSVRFGVAFGPSRQRNRL